MVDSGLVMLMMLVLMILMVVGIIKVISKGPTNNPTWKGIIISVIFGMLPLYLICCFMGIMGEERDLDRK